MAYVYPQAYLWQPPQPYNTTHLNQSFPEHHYPLEDARHRIGHAFDFFHDDNISSPHSDIRETIHNYYIDVDLPGIGRDDLKMKWSNERTLLLEATKARSDISEAVEPPLEQLPSATPSATASKSDTGKPAKGALQHPVHQLTKERFVGNLVRAFNFPVDVDRETMTAKLQHGLLAIVVPKVEEHKIEPTPVKVEAL
ncbi:HSP20-like chaperone [Rhizodiscina lignyota]|uniref:HSP20-like chaperone n=1 Tax=Rhizodiscina lignyota TaxID=1504668 RepID=A0A9P4IDD5_9PEZI|nr:HSP20-like chaperone [Rhizodiscina lignyota]